MKNIGITVKIIIALSFTIVLSPSQLQATINIPTCEKLKDFPLKDIRYVDYNPILKEYFGSNLIDWQDNDFNLFASSFKECRKKNNDFISNNYSDSSLVRDVDYASEDLKIVYKQELVLKVPTDEFNKLNQELDPLLEQAKSLTISEAGLTRIQELGDKSKELTKKYLGLGIYFERIVPGIDYVMMIREKALQEKKWLEDSARQKAEEEARIKQKSQEESNEAQSLLKKHGKIGPPSDFLVSQFQTYSPARGLSGNVSTLIKFYDILDGKKKWDKRDELWVLTQSKVDSSTGKKHEIIYAFGDLRAKLGSVWLERVVIDKQEIPPKNLMYLVLKAMGKM